MSHLAGASLAAACLLAAEASTTAQAQAPAQSAPATQPTRAQQPDEKVFASRDWQRHIISHTMFIRRWFGSVTRARREPRSLINIGVTFALLVTTLTLVITSVLISSALSAFPPAGGGFAVRQIHTLAAYWILVIVAIHLGLRWPMLMSIARNLSGISRPSALRTAALRAIAITVAVHGIWSFHELGLGSKLSMQMTLDWWNFEEAAAGFFIHCIAVAGLAISATYYGLKLIRLAKAARSSDHVLVGAEPAPASPR